MEIILAGAFAAFVIHFLGDILMMLTGEDDYLENFVFVGSIVLFVFLAVAIWLSLARKPD